MTPPLCLDIKKIYDDLKTYYDKKLSEWKQEKETLEAQRSQCIGTGQVPRTRPVPMHCDPVSLDLLSRLSNVALSTKTPDTMTLMCEPLLKENTDK